MIEAGRRCAIAHAIEKSPVIDEWLDEVRNRAAEVDSVQMSRNYAGVLEREFDLRLVQYRCGIGFRMQRFCVHKAYNSWVFSGRSLQDGVPSSVRNHLRTLAPGRTKISTKKPLKMDVTSGKIVHTASGCYSEMMCSVPILGSVCRRNQQCPNFVLACELDHQQYRGT